MRAASCPLSEGCPAIMPGRRRPCGCYVCRRKHKETVAESTWHRHKQFREEEANALEAEEGFDGHVDLQRRRTDGCGLRNDVRGEELLVLTRRGVVTVENVTFPELLNL